MVDFWAVEVEAVDFPEVDAGGKDEATLRGKQTLGRMRLVSTPLWSLRPPLIFGKAALRVMRATWHANDRDAFAAQEERRSSWRRAKRGGVVACGVCVSGGGEPPGAGSAGDGHACLPRAFAVRAIHDDPL